MAHSLLKFGTLILVLGIVGGCSLNDSARHYNDTMVDLVESSIGTYQDYNDSVVDLYDFDEIEELRSDTVSSLYLLLDEVEELGAYKGYTGFLDAGVALLDGSLDLLENEEVALIAIWKEGTRYSADTITDAIEQELTDREDALIETIVETHDSLVDAIVDAQELFAETHDLELE